MGAPPLPTPAPGAAVSQHPQTRTSLSACRISRLSTRSVFRFSRYSLCTNATENAIPLVMKVTWCDMFHCTGTVRLAPDCVATPLPTALLFLHGVTVVAETVCLPSTHLQQSSPWIRYFVLQAPCQNIKVFIYLNQIGGSRFWCCSHNEYPRAEPYLPDCSCRIMKINCDWNPIRKILAVPSWS
jgi:hypothetical protein